MEYSITNAVSVPMNIAKTVNALWPTLKEMAEVCNNNCISDLQVRQDVVKMNAHSCLH